MSTQALPSSDCLNPPWCRRRGKRLKYGDAVRNREQAILISKLLRGRPKSANPSWNRWVGEEEGQERMLGSGRPPMRGRLGRWRDPRGGHPGRWRRREVDGTAALPSSAAAVERPARAPTTGADARPSCWTQGGAVVGPAGTSRC